MTDDPMMTLIRTLFSWMSLDFKVEGGEANKNIAPFSIEI